jgi:hypothetical protein
MRHTLLIAAAALVAFAGPANAAKVKMPNGTVRHIWYYVDFADAKCRISQYTPEEYASDMDGDRIPPDHVLKDADGNLTVRVDVKADGDTKMSVFFTSEDKCETAIKDTGLKPDQAPHSDIN